MEHPTTPNTIEAATVLIMSDSETQYENDAFEIPSDSDDSLKTDSEEDVFPMCTCCQANNRSDTFKQAVADATLAVINQILEINISEAVEEEQRTIRLQTVGASSDESKWGITHVEMLEKGFHGQFNATVSEGAIQIYRSYVMPSTPPPHQMQTNILTSDVGNTSASIEVTNNIPHHSKRKHDADSRMKKELERLRGIKKALTQGNYLTKTSPLLQNVTPENDTSQQVDE